MRLTSLALVAVFAAAPALAADAHHHHGDTHAAPAQKGAAPAAQGQDVEADGTVNSIDPEALLVNISHGPIPAFKWPAMTMDLAVAEAALLEKVQPGDKVKFKLRKLSNVDYTIVQIDKAK